jgi:hypothetical protein
MSATLKIASWNINSVRARLAIVEKFLREEVARYPLPSGDEGARLRFSG